MNSGINCTVRVEGPHLCSLCWYGNECAKLPVCISGETGEWPSTTVVPTQSLSCCSSTACWATADRLTPPDTSALLCSFRRCSRVQPVWPMYTFAQDYRDPVDHTWLLLGGSAVFQVYKSLAEGPVGQKQVQMPRGARMHCIYGLPRVLDI